jgi:hypothetical protein
MSNLLTWNHATVTVCHSKTKDLPDVVCIRYLVEFCLLVSSGHRVETYRDVTDRCKHCGSLRFHVPTFFQATGQKMINCACSASLKWAVIRSSSNQMHASSNLPSMRAKKVGTLVTSLYVYTLCSGSPDGSDLTLTTANSHRLNMHLIG